jgi:hypothetical protein
MGVPPINPTSVGGGDMAVALSTAIGIAAAISGWSLARLADGRGRSATANPEPDRFARVP